MAIISGIYGGADFTDPADAHEYIEQYGLEMSATHDPEGFWGGFSMYIPNNLIINLQTMKLEYMANTMYAEDVRDILDRLLE